MYMERMEMANKATEEYIQLLLPKWKWNNVYISRNSASFSHQHFDFIMQYWIQNCGLHSLSCGNECKPHHHRRIHGNQHFLHSCLFFLKRRTFNLYKANHQHGFDWIDWVIYRTFRFYFDPIWFFIQLEQKMKNAVRFVVFNSIRYWIGPISYLANVIAGFTLFAHMCTLCIRCILSPQIVHRTKNQPTFVVFQLFLLRSCTSICTKTKISIL